MVGVCVCGSYACFSVSRPPSCRLHESGNFVLLIALDLQQCLIEVYAQEIGYYFFFHCMNERLKTLRCLSEPKVEKHLGVSSPSPEVLFTLKYPGLGWREWEMWQSLSGSLCIGEGSETPKAQGCPGEETQEGQGNGQHY